MSSTSADSRASPGAGVDHRRSSIPVHLTSFLGREREIAELCRLLESRRLLTLTGAGGSGKTRLAAEVAGRLEPAYPGGVAWIDLAPLADGALAARETSMGLGLHEDLGRDDVDVLIGTLRDQSMLLVLDNCEHVVADTAALADRLLRACPALRVMATSRQALGIAGETAWLVPPLSLPDSRGAVTAQAAGSSDAVRLFLERAQAASPSFVLSDENAGAIVQICRRLDGIPLAIELAAARVRVLAPIQIAERLDDAFRLLTGGSRTAIPRHKTLRETLDWSHALLSASEQRLLARSAVFAGGFSLVAAEAVCGDDALAEWDVLDALAGLVDKSLVVLETGPVGPRYRLLETVRQYAHERLRGSGEAERMRERHAEFFVAFAESAEPHIFGGENRGGWLSRLDAEHENLRAAGDWCTEDGARAEYALRLSAALHWFWFARGRFREAAERLEASLLAEGDARAAVRARAMSARSAVAFWAGDPAGIRAPAEQAVALLRAAGTGEDPRAFAYALVTAGVGAVVTGEPDAAAPSLDEAVAIARSLGQQDLLCFALYWRGLGAQARRDYPLARACFEEAVAIGRRLGSGPGTAHPLTVLGRLAILEGDHTSGHESLADALAIHAAGEDRWGSALALEGLASIAAAGADHERAVRLLGLATALRDEIGAAPLQDREQRDEILAAARAALGPAAFRNAWEGGWGMGLDGAASYARNGGGGPIATEPVVPSGPDVDGAGGARHVLRVLALGPLEVSLDAKALDAAAWGSAKARELLLFLLCHPNGATREQVGLALWPDASAAQVRNNFHVTLHRLRKALGGPDRVVLVNERYRLGPSLQLELDADRFETGVMAALREVRAGGDAVPALEAALALYRGGFLEDEPVGDWHLERRDHLQRLCRDALSALGDRLMQAGRHTEAAAAYRRLVAADELNEEAYRRLMVCHLRLGERTEALRLYRRLVELLRDELDAGPDPKTTALFERLQNAEPV